MAFLSSPWDFISVVLNCSVRLFWEDAIVQSNGQIQAKLGGKLSQASSLETVPQYISTQHRVTDTSLTLNFKMANTFYPSSETQGQIKGARESLNGRKNMTRRKVKNGEKSPWGQCLTRPVPDGRRCSGFWLVAENLCFSGTNQKAERRRPLELVW